MAPHWLSLTTPLSSMVPVMGACVKYCMPLGVNSMENMYTSPYDVLCQMRWGRMETVPATESMTMSTVSSRP